MACIPRVPHRFFRLLCVAMILAIFLGHVYKCMRLMKQWFKSLWNPLLGSSIDMYYWQLCFSFGFKHFLRNVVLHLNCKMSCKYNFSFDFQNFLWKSCFSLDLNKCFVTLRANLQAHRENGSVLFQHAWLICFTFRLYWRYFLFVQAR